MGFLLETFGDIKLNDWQSRKSKHINNNNYSDKKNNTYILA